MTLTTVLLDLDGVIRHFDPAHRQSIETQYTLARGTLRAAAFAPEVIEPAITGKISRSEWTRRVGDRVGNPDAAAEWLADRGEIDASMIELVDQLRGAGTVVAILTNGTSTITDEMEELGLVPHFDAIFNSAEIGYAKPDVRAFQACCNDLRVDPTEVFFTDDSAAKLAGAIELGMTAEDFTSAERLRESLTALNLLP